MAKYLSILFVSLFVYLGWDFNSNTRSVFSQTCEKPDHRVSDRDRFKVNCQVALWYYENPTGKFAAKDLDPYLCTHISLVYLWITTENKISFPDNNQQSLKLLKDIVSLRKIKPTLQIIAVVGGWNDFDLRKYEKLAVESELDILVKNIIQFLRIYDLDGIDFAWNHLGRTSNINTDIETLNKITLKLCPKLRNYGMLCVVTLIQATFGNPTNRDILNNKLKQIIQNADLINLWTMDIPSPHNDRSLFHNNRLQASGSSSNSDDPISTINQIVEYYTKTLRLNNATIKKLLMMIPFEAYIQYETTDEVSFKANYEFQRSYAWACERFTMDLDNTEAYHLETRDGYPFAVSNKTRSGDLTVFVPINTIDYVKKKVEYAMAQNLGGISILHVTADDYRGWCHNMSYPLLSTINDIMAFCRFP